MSYENTLMLFKQDVKLGPYFVKWQLAIDRGLPRIPINYLQNIYSGPIPRVV